MTRTGVLGGMFDPFHRGHEAAALAAQQRLALDRLVLVPSRRPPHRPGQPQASGADRLAMARMAASAHASWTVSDTELTREGTSYTFDTLMEFVNWGQTPCSLFFILGADAFAEISTWSRYPAVLDLANFVVIAREGITLDSLGNRLPSLAGRMTTASTPIEAEGTSIILIDVVTPPVSSTDIRRRVQGGESIAGMVPSKVDTYIHAHQLYRVSQTGLGR